MRGNNRKASDDISTCCLTHTIWQTASQALRVPRSRGLSTEKCVTAVSFVAVNDTEGHVLIMKRGKVTLEVRNKKKQLNNNNNIRRKRASFSVAAHPGPDFYVKKRQWFHSSWIIKQGKSLSLAVRVRTWGYFSVGRRGSFKGLTNCL